LILLRTPKKKKTGNNKKLITDRLHIDLAFWFCIQRTSLNLLKITTRKKLLIYISGKYQQELAKIVNSKLIYTNYLRPFCFFNTLRETILILFNNFSMVRQLFYTPKSQRRKYNPCRTIGNVLNSISSI